jgi:hypothetical protein
MYYNFFSKSSRFLENVEKYGRGRQATGDNMIGFTHFPCRITTVRTDRQTDTVTILNTSCFYLAAVVTRHCFTVLYTACLVKFSVTYGNVVSTESCICHMEVTCNVHYFYYLLYQT